MNEIPHLVPISVFSFANKQFYRFGATIQCPKGLDKPLDCFRYSNGTSKEIDCKRAKETICIQSSSICNSKGRNEKIR